MGGYLGRTKTLSTTLSMTASPWREKPDISHTRSIHSNNLIGITTGLQGSK